MKTAPFKEVSIPEQKVVNGISFPLVLLPESSSAASLAEAVRAHKPWVEARLQEAGAVLFRGFDTPTASEFSSVLEAFGYDDFPFDMGLAERTHVVGGIYTANDGPSHVNLHFHNEMSYLKHTPSKAFFYCEIEPSSQGETPIVLGHVVFERLMEKHSNFLRCLEEHGVVYRQMMAHEANGRNWKSRFSTDNKTIAEHKAIETGWKLEWLEEGVRVIMGPVPGIKTDTTQSKERKIWFNHIVPLMALSTYIDARNEVGKAVTLGDGTPIPPDMVEDCKVIVEEECVAFPWKQGDILMLDNWAVQHSRRPYTPPRRVLAAFTK